MVRPEDCSEDVEEEAKSLVETVEGGAILAVAARNTAASTTNAMIPRKENENDPTKRIEDWDGCNVPNPLTREKNAFSPLLQPSSMEIVSGQVRGAVREL